MAMIALEPDAAASGFELGPRTMVRTEDLGESGLLEPGTLFDTKYRMELPPGSDLAALQAEAEGLFESTGMRWRDARNGAPGITAFVERLGGFLVLVGLSGLAVGGAEVSAYSPMSLSRPTVNPGRLPTSRTAIITPGMKLSRLIESWRIVSVCPSVP